MADGSPLQAPLDQRSIASSLAITERAVRQRAQKENWPFTEEPVRGGRRRLYCLASLPSDVQAAVARHQAIQAANRVSTSEHYQAGQSIGRKCTIAEKVDAKVQQRVISTGASEAAGLSGNKKQRMEARLSILSRLDAFAEKRRMGVCNAMQDFCTAYGLGDLQVPIEVRQFVGPRLCPMTLRRWKKTLKKQGAAALGGDYGNRFGTSIIDTNDNMRDLVIGLMADKPHVSAKIVYQAIEVRFSDALPSPRSVARFMVKWKTENAEAFMAVTNSDAWKNKYKTAQGALDEDVARINQRWQVDSTPGDIQLIDGRYNILGAIDLATRRVKLHVAKTSNAHAVSMLIRKCIIAWGVPEQIKMDNGADYASTRVQNALTALEIQARFSAPFSPWEKGNIERVFQTFSHGLLEILPGYAGHNVADAQTLRAQKSFAERMFKKNQVTEIKLTSAELQLFCDRWTDSDYAHKKHEGLKGLSPFERSMQLRDHLRTIDDVRALDMLLADVPDNNGMRMVHKKGVRVEKHWYAAPEFGAITNQPVLCRYLDDIGQLAIYHQDAFLCIAECPEILGFSRLEVSSAAKRIQNETVAVKRKELKRLARKVDTAQVVEDILLRKEEAAAKLSAFPAPNIIHLTPALEAAADAAAAIDAAPKQAELEPITVHHLDDVRDLRVREFAVEETSNERFKRAMDYLLVPENERNDIQNQFLRGHITSSEFLGRWDIFEGFGPSALEQFGLNEKHLALMPDGAFYHRYIQLKAAQGEN